MKTLIICFLFTLPHMVFSQKISKATYVCETNISKGKSQDGYNNLYFTGSKSIYIHENYPKENSYFEKGNSITFVKGDKEGFPVYMDIEKNKMIYKSDYSAVKEIFIFEDTIPKIHWVTHTESKLIGELYCLKAVGEYGGRIYDVWFAPSIPSKFGPYKLNGLPGLIVKANSRDKRVNYELVKFYPTIDEIESIEEPADGKKITHSEFKNFIINKYLRVRSLSTADVQITNNDPDVNWEIEKSRFTIISDFENASTSKN